MDSKEAAFEVILASIEMYIVGNTFLVRLQVNTSLAHAPVWVSFHYPNSTPMQMAKQQMNWDRLRIGIDDIPIKLRKTIEESTVYTIANPSATDIDSIEPYKLN